MQKVLIDIYHLPQFNFFKNTILHFHPDEVDVYCVNRGKLLNVIRHELPDYRVTCLGDYKYNKGMMSMIFRIILPRIGGLFRAINPSKYKYILTANYQANLVGRIKGIPNIAFNDDPRKVVFPILKFFADEVYLPPFGNGYSGVRFFNALKEWAYLSPKYFTPNQTALVPYGLKPKKYIFIREVSTRTSNYLSQDEDAILSIAHDFPKDIPVVLSLEVKENARRYPDHWIILQEPVADIHSLMYHSELVISSGDSMAREGAMLGVPSIYAGNRDMPANKILIDKKMLVKVLPSQVVALATAILHKEKNFPAQTAFRQMLFEQWDDITELILSKIGREVSVNVT